MSATIVNDTRLTERHRELIRILAEAAVEVYLEELAAADEVGQQLERDIDGGSQ